ncbi:hypothetical protein CTAYLR_005855 [Chrysophaeum taylorii]|uniref:Enoyl reductase (ER) domain-containing protein n=1 Tax=Chrysophaeum taylorii TaxID=2483200 RepID=A0AAD7UQH7_9STRA|nr:hypothetical protein CTAYLR_005855 [Chrysophaeum taylorii]
MELLPSTYKRLMLISPGEEDVEDAKIEVRETTMPGSLKMDEVLIKVAAAPVNPSDYGAWVRPASGEWKPKAIGNEGAGTVVRVGSNIACAVAGVKVGSKVGFTGLRSDQGSYGEYVVAPLSTTFVMDDSLPVEDAASFFVNPFTAVGILDTVASKHSSARAFVHTAAASQLGQMLVKLVTEVELINVVRSEKQAELLRELGAKHVVIVEDANDDADPGLPKLRELVDALGATVAFDAVAGAMTGKLVTFLPPKSTVYVYGRLDGDIKGVAPIDLIYRGKKLAGWYLRSYLTGDGVLATARRMSVAAAKVRAGLGRGGWCASTFADCTMATFWTTFLDIRNSTGFTDRKLRIRFAPEG